MLRLPWSRRLATYAISAAPVGVSDEQLLSCIDDVAHCPAYFQLMVKALLLHGLRELAQTCIPAHLVICGKDRIIPSPRFSRHFTAHLPAETVLTRLDNVGHVPMFEAPEQITDVIASFLAQHHPPDQVSNPAAS